MRSPGALVRQGRHLVRRFAGMVSPAAPSPEDEAWAAGHLDAAEQVLWAQLCNADRRHSIHTARRFLAARPAATGGEIAGALLHDVGKLRSRLGVTGRVVATVVGPHGGRFAAYHDHERLGAELLVEIGSAPDTIDLVAGRGPAVEALDRADHV